MVFGPTNVYVAQQSAFNIPVAANTAAVITLGATANVFWVIDSIHYGYATNPTGGGLTITWGPAPITIFSLDITSNEDVETVFPRGLYSTTPNRQMVITLAAGGAAVIGRLNVTYR